MIETKSKIDNLHFDITIDENYIELRIPIFLDGSCYKSAEKRLPIKKPFKSLEIDYPGILKARSYQYYHANQEIYVFYDSGKKKGRMFYLFEGGAQIPVDTKPMFILIPKECTINRTEYVRIERLIWKEYTIYSIDLADVEDLQVRRDGSTSDFSIVVEPSFSLQGTTLYDDLFMQYPLFTDLPIKLKANSKYISGWDVWLHPEGGLPRRIKREWQGKGKSILIESTLPSKTGIYQVDMTMADTTFSYGTLFFRLLPEFFIRYNDGIIFLVDKPYDAEPVDFPGNYRVDFNPKSGSKASKHKLGQKIERYRNRFYIPPDMDTCDFAVSTFNNNSKQVPIKIKLKRVKWAISDSIVSAVVKDWNNKRITVVKEEMSYGKDQYLLLKNNFNSDPSLEITCHVTNEKGTIFNKTTVQSIGGNFFYVYLNGFYDTIRNEKGTNYIWIVFQHGGDIIKSDHLIEYIDGDVGREDILDSMPSGKYVNIKYLIKYMGITNVPRAKLLQKNLKSLVADGLIEKEIQDGKEYFRKIQTGNNEEQSFKEIEISAPMIDKVQEIEEFNEEDIFRHLPEGKYVRITRIIKALNVTYVPAAKALQVKLNTLVSQGKLTKIRQNGKLYYKIKTSIGKAEEGESSDHLVSAETGKNETTFQDNYEDFGENNDNSEPPDQEVPIPHQAPDLDENSLNLNEFMLPTEKNILGVIPEGIQVTIEWIIKRLRITSPVDSRFVEVKIKSMIKQGKLEKSEYNGKAFFNKKQETRHD
nr:hypothetical protein [Candidatus Sigynarchaeota archaeon]